MLLFIKMKSFWSKLCYSISNLPIVNSMNSKIRSDAMVWFDIDLTIQWRVQWKPSTKSLDFK